MSSVPDGGGLEVLFVYMLGNTFEEPVLHQTLFLHKHAAAGPSQYLPGRTAPGTASAALVLRARGSSSRTDIAYT